MNNYPAAIYVRPGAPGRREGAYKPHNRSPSWPSGSSEIGAIERVFGTPRTSKQLDGFSHAIGHARVSGGSSYVLAKSVAASDGFPVLILVVVPVDDYREVGFDPFIAAEAGIFSEAERVLTKGGSGLPKADLSLPEANWSTPREAASSAEPTSPNLSELLKRKQIVLGVSRPTTGLDALKTACRSVGAGQLSRRDICSFSFWEPHQFKGDVLASVQCEVDTWKTQLKDGVPAPIKLAESSGSSRRTTQPMPLRGGDPLLRLQSQGVRAGSLNDPSRRRRN